MELSPYTMVFQVINFLVLVLVLQRFLFKPITAILRQRQEQVQMELDQAAHAREQAEQLHRQGERTVATASQRVEDLLKEATRRAEQLHAEAVTNAEERARRLIEEAEARIKVEHEAARQALRQEVASLAVSIAVKALPKAFDTDQQRLLIDAAIREVSSDGG